MFSVRLLLLVLLEKLMTRFSACRDLDVRLKQYMGKANAMGGPQNMALNVVCYSAVFGVFRVHPCVALKVRY